jgi:hypothetical protein
MISINYKIERGNPRKVNVTAQVVHLKDKLTVEKNTEFSQPTMRLKHGKVIADHKA